MDVTCSRKAISHSPNTRKRKRAQKAAADPLNVKRHSFANNISIDELPNDPFNAKRHSFANNISIDELPDDILIAILSCMSFNDAVRTSVLSSRWRYLWMFTSGILEFDDTDNNSTKNKRKLFKSWVNRVLSLHQSQKVNSLVIRFANLRLRARSRDIDSWIYSAMQKEVEKFELDLSVENGFHCCYKFPKIEKLLSCSSGVHVKSYAFFVSLRSLRLVDVDIDDEVVRYFLSSCPFIEHLCIRASNATKNLEVVGALPNLKELEISNCVNLKSMEISAMNLVSCTFQGRRKINLPFKKVPNLTELTLGGLFWRSFVYQPNKHSIYSVQLVKLVLNLPAVVRDKRKVPRNLPHLYSLKQLELNIVTEVSRSLLFFISLIKASPNLEEFKIKMEYAVKDYRSSMRRSVQKLKGSFPYVSSTEAFEFHHQNLKIVEMVGFVGLSRERDFLVQLCKVAPSVEMVSIDTRSDYYLRSPIAYLLFTQCGEKKSSIHRDLKSLAKSFAKDLKNYSPPGIKFVVI